MQNNYLIGHFAFGYFNVHEFTKEEQIHIKLLGSALSPLIYTKLINENKNSKIDELTESLRQVRHDFANDIQSLALALELLASTELSEDQAKYLNILTNAKESAINRIIKLTYIDISLNL